MTESANTAHARPSARRGIWRHLIFSVVVLSLLGGVLVVCAAKGPVERYLDLIERGQLTAAYRQTTLATEPIPRGVGSAIDERHFTAFFTQNKLRSYSNADEKSIVTTLVFESGLRTRVSFRMRHGLVVHATKQLVVGTKGGPLSHLAIDGVAVTASGKVADMSCSLCARDPGHYQYRVYVLEGGRHVVATPASAVTTAASETVEPPRSSFVFRSGESLRDDVTLELSARPEAIRRANGIARRAITSCGSNCALLSCDPSLGDLLGRPWVVPSSAQVRAGTSLVTDATLKHQASGWAIEVPLRVRGRKTTAIVFPFSEEQVQDVSAEVRVIVGFPRTGAPRLLERCFTRVSQA